MEGAPSSKRHKELENAALQSSLSSDALAEGSGLTLTDHLNKRLLLSFQEKLNQAQGDFLNRIQQLQSQQEPHEEEDSNRVQEDW